MTPILRRACEYVRNTGGNATEAIFDDDHEPIGPRLRADLHYEGLIRVEDGKLHLTYKASQALSDPVF
jgi:hypothetical protein